jgi:hypothetical protein
MVSAVRSPTGPHPATCSDVAYAYRLVRVPVQDQESGRTCVRHQVGGRGRLFHRRQWWPHYVRDDGRSRLCPARTSSGMAPVMRDPVTRHVECPAMLARGGDAALLRLRYCVFSEASTSMTSWILSPTTTPPVGSAMLAVMPQSVRLISPMADRPARVPP